MSSVALEELCLIKKVTPNKVGFIRVYDFGLFVDTQTESMCYKLGIRNVKILVFKAAREEIFPSSDGEEMVLLILIGQHL